MSRDGTRGTFNSQPYVTSSQPLRILNATATTTTAGALTYDYSAVGFTAVYGVHLQPVRNTADPTLACFALLRSYSTTQLVAQIFESKTSAVLLLGVNIEGLETTAAAIPVLITVFGL